MQGYAAQHKTDRTNQDYSTIKILTIKTPGGGFGLGLGGSTMISFTLAGGGVALTCAFATTDGVVRLFFGATTSSSDSSSSSSSSDDEDASVCDAFPLGTAREDLDELLTAAERFRLAGGGVGSCTNNWHCSEGTGSQSQLFFLQAMSWWVHVGTAGLSCLSLVVPWSEPTALNYEKPHQDRREGWQLVWTYWKASQSTTVSH